MANYKSIIDVESVEQATEAMNVLVEDGGSLKKVPAVGMIGGCGGSNFCFIDINAPEATEYVVQASNEYKASMSYNELIALIESKELGGVIIRDHATHYPGHGFYLSEGIIYDGSVITIYYYSNNNTEFILYYFSDDTISNESGAPV